MTTAMDASLAYRRRLANWVTLSAVYGLLGLVLPLWVLAPLPELYGWDLGRWMATLITQYCALRLALLATSGEPRFPTITFFVFIYTWCGLAAMAELATQHFPWIVVHRSDDAVEATLMIAIAIAMFELGRLAARVRPRRPSKYRLELQISRGMVSVVCVLSTLLLVIGVAMIGSVGALFGTRAHLEAVVAHLDKMTKLIALSLIRSPPFVALMLTLYFGATRWSTLDRSGKRTMVTWATLMAVLNVAANFPPASYRSWFSAVVLTPLFALVPWRRWLAAFWVLALCLSAIVILPYMDVFRRAPTFDAGIDALAVSSNVVDPMLNKGDYDVFQQTANGVTYVDRFGIDYGHNLLSAVLFWVPRAYWPEKSPGSNVEVNGSLGYSFTNLSMPLWVEAYVAASWLGVVLMLGGYGYVSARGEAAYLQTLTSDSSARIAGLLVPFWGAYQFFIMRGDLQNVIAFSSVAVALFIGVTRPRLRRMPGATPLPGRI